MFQQKSPGSGGVDFGRADAEFALGEETPLTADELDSARLEAAELLDLDSSHLLGLGTATPEVDGRGEATGLQRLGADSGKAAWSRRLAPRHRRAVGRFFGDGR